MKKNNIITLSREYGSGGRRIGERAAKELGIPYYDKSLIELSAKESGLSTDYVEHNEQKITNSFLFNLSVSNGYYPGPMSYQDSLRPEDSLFLAQVRLVRELADKGPCVIVGRCADYILRERDDVLNVFVYAELQYRLQNAIRREGLDPDTAPSRLRKIDKLRANHYGYYTGQEWGDRKNYHICLNSKALGEDKAVEVICALAR